MAPLIKVKNLVKKFPIKKGFFNREVGAVHAVNNINLEIKKGETLGLVGESGCGKSTAGRCILGLIDPTSGKVEFKGEESKDRKKMQIVFQNPYSSLNPRMTIENILKEPLIIHQKLTKKEQKTRVIELLEMVGMNESVMNRYPHEFSGGQRQRIGIARALMLNPEFIVADEPVSALDISIQAQIINLLQQLKRDFSLTYLFISHDLAVIRYMCDRVAVMYLGEIVEIAPAKELFDNPKHPYTQALLGKEIIKGDVPSPVNPPSGCKFHTRCSHAMGVCSKEPPKEIVAGEQHLASCHLLSK